MARGLFITGTNTEVGKTYVACLIARALRQAGVQVGVYKPVASGCHVEGTNLVSDDAVALWEAAGRPGTLDQVCPQRFAAPVAPPVAARQEGKSIDLDLLITGLQAWSTTSEVVLVEGAGGLMSPVADEMFNADLAYELGFPLVLVAPNVLGVINQTLQTLITASTFREGLDLAGIVLNEVQATSDSSTASNRAELEKYCVAPVLAEAGWLAAEFSTPVAWHDLAQEPLQR